MFPHIPCLFLFPGQSPHILLTLKQAPQIFSQIPKQAPQIFCPPQVLSQIPSAISPNSLPGAGSPYSLSGAGPPPLISRSPPHPPATDSYREAGNDRSFNVGRQFFYSDNFPLKKVVLLLMNNEPNLFDISRDIFLLLQILYYSGGYLAM